jgi:hypothetical protein
MSLEQTLGTQVIAATRLLRPGFSRMTTVYSALEALARMIPAWVVWCRRSSRSVLAPDQAHFVNGLPQPEDMKKTNEVPAIGTWTNVWKSSRMSASEQDINEDGSTVAEPNLTDFPQRLIWCPAQQLLVVIQALVYTVQRQ